MSKRRVELLQLRPFSYEEKGVYYKETDMYEDLVEQVDAYQPNLIAITLVEDTYDLGMSLLAAISHVNIPVVAGGVYVTFAPDEVLANDNVDLVCVGEGEDALVELCQKMSRGEDYSCGSKPLVKKRRPRHQESPEEAQRHQHASLY